MPVQARRLEVAEYQRFRDLVVTRLAAEAARSLGCGDAGLEAAEKALRRRRGRLQEHRRPAPQASRNAPDRRRRRRHHRPALRRGQQPVGCHPQRPARSDANRLTSPGPKMILVTYKNDAHPASAGPGLFVRPACEHHGRRR